MAAAPTSRRPRLFVAALAIVLASCTPKVFVPPAGPGEPFPEAATAWAQATRACHGASTYAATMHVHGKVGRESLNATIIGLVTRADQISLSMPVMFGAPAFVLGGTADAATLWLPRNKQMLNARADEILEALTGLKLGPRALLAVLTGCGGQADVITSSARYADLGAISTADGRMFVQNRDARWRVTRGLTAGLIVEYSDPQGDWPRMVRVTTDTGHEPVVSLTLTLEEIDVNLPHEARDFVVRPNADAQPITLDDLRAAGPLREKK